MNIRIKQLDDTEKWITARFMRFLCQRAEIFDVLRRQPKDGYDISFLITNKHMEQLMKHKIVDFLIQFMEDIDKEINEIKLDTSSRARVAGECLLKGFC